jgi:outer membrane protein assembly factor BamB
VAGQPGVTSPAPASIPATGWPTYHATNDRAGLATGATRPSSLALSWTGHVDGAVYGQPLVVGTSVIAATENNTVYSFDLATGAPLWRAHLASPIARSDLPCGNIDPLGITGTPAYDAATGSVFVVTETTGGSHELVAVDAANGRVRFSRNLDVAGHNRLAEQERGALAVANGRVYVPFGGLFGDCDDYIGYVTATATDGTGPVAHYAVPTAREAGIWAPPGVAVAANGSVFVAAGNGAATGGAYDGSDAVVHLSADLSSRLDFFAPRAWAAQNASDRDLGSTGPLLLASGRVVVAGKDGTVYLLDAAKLGGVGGQVASASGCTGFGGLAADGAAVFVPCSEGLRRFDTTASSLTGRWRANVTGSPVVGGGVVWALDTDNGSLFALDEKTGAAVAYIGVGEVTRFASPVVLPGVAVVGTRSSVVAIKINR